MTEQRANKMREKQAEPEWTDIPFVTDPEQPAPAKTGEPLTETPSAEKKRPKKPHRGRKRLQEVLGGDYLSNNTVVDNIPFIIYLAILALLYIANTYNTERMYKEIEKTKTELKELRYQYITARSGLMFESKLSELNKRTQAIGLKETVIPPYKIFYSEDSIHIGNR